MDVNYSSVLTGASFMQYEFKQVAMLKAQGLSDKEIRQKVIKENVFQYEKISSLKRGLPSILRRTNALDETLRNFVLQGTIEIGKTINLYAIMKTDRLFFEFMDEVIREKLDLHDYTFEKKDLNTYFTVKSEQSSTVAKWTESTLNKLKQVYRRILLEAGLLRDKKSSELNRLVIDDQIKSHLLQIGDAKYVRAMGG
jgi:hypothetical protein